MGTPYAISSDLVSAYPAKSLAIAQYIDGFKTDLAMEQNAQTGVSYSLALADFTKLVTLSNASAVAVTLPLEATVAWPTGTQLRLLNVGAGTVTVAGAVGVTINGSPLTLAQFKAATLVKNGTNTWTFLPFSSGVGAANFSDTATGTYTGYKYLAFTASGTITIDRAGFADIVVCGGGGGGGGRSNGYTGGGGAGGSLQITSAYLPVGTLTVTVGGGGPGRDANRGEPGITTRLGQFYSTGGGGGGGGTGAVSTIGESGASGGGGQGSTAEQSIGGAGVGGIGFAGGNSTLSTNAGGGGGAAAVGANGATTVGGAGGAGTTTTIAGTALTGSYSAGSYAYGGGGGGAGSVTQGAGGSGGGGGAANPGTAGGANKGAGGGGVPFAASSGGNGGSGFVIVRVAV
jgi:hypothetical protein